MTSIQRLARTLSIFLLFLFPLGLLSACDSSESGMSTEAVPDQISYELTAQSNEGAAPDGVGGTVTFWRAGPNTTLVTLNLDANATAGGVSHPAHIHNNSVSDGGEVEYYLSAVNGSSPNGTTARKIGEPIEFFADFDGHVNVHESPGEIGTLVAQGDIGANAEGTPGPGLDLVDDPSTTTRTLSAVATDGSVFPDGVTGTTTFQQLTDSQTLVTYAFDIPGSVSDANEGDVSVAQVAHIHEGELPNPSSGMIVGEPPFSGYLGSIAPTDPAARSSRIINASFDALTSYSGYVNVHESNGNLGAVFAQGNIKEDAGEDGENSGADVTVTVDNVGSSAWEVTNVAGGDGVAQTGTDNPSLTLTEGTRYRFENNGDSAHPLGFQNGSSEYLLNQNGSGDVEDDADVNYVEDESGITFTYTQSLADAVASYRCTVHPSMEGDVQTDSGSSGY
jgi:hypothetical protein